MICCCQSPFSLLLHSFGFVEFRGEEDADYAIKIMNMIKMFGKPIRVNKASRDKKTLDVGANLFIGNLDPDVDEKLLYDTFSAFGVVISTRVSFPAAPAIHLSIRLRISSLFLTNAFPCFPAKSHPTA